MTPEKLKTWRDEHNVSQGELADILGVNRFTVSKWESAVQKAPPYLELALCEAARRIKKKKPQK